MHLNNQILDGFASQLKDRLESRNNEKFIPNDIVEINLGSLGIDPFSEGTIEDSIFFKMISFLYKANIKFQFVFSDNNQKIALKPISHTMINNAVSSVLAEGVFFNLYSLYHFHFFIADLGNGEIKHKSFFKDLIGEDDEEEYEWCPDCGELLEDCTCYCEYCGGYQDECQCERCPNCDSFEHWDGTNCFNCGYSEEEDEEEVGWGEEAPFACPRCKATLRHYNNYSEEYLSCPNCGWGTDAYYLDCPHCGETAIWSEEEGDMFCDSCGWRDWVEWCDVCDGVLNEFGECDNGCWGEGCCPECGINDGSFMGVECSNCGHVQAITCTGCGAKLEGTHCEECGKYFCHYCGVEMDKITDTKYGCDGCCFGYCTIHDRWTGDYNEMCPECAKVIECPCCGNTEVYYSEEDRFSRCDACGWDVREEYYECPDCGEPFCSGFESEEHCIKCGWSNEDPEDSEDPEEEVFCFKCDVAMSLVSDDEYECPNCRELYKVCPECDSVTRNEAGVCIACGYGSEQ